MVAVDVVPSEGSGDLKALGRCAFRLPNQEVVARERVPETCALPVPFLSRTSFQPVAPCQRLALSPSPPFLLPSFTMSSSSPTIPQITVLGSTDDLPEEAPHPHHRAPSPPDSAHRARSPSDPTFLALPTPILRSNRNSIDASSDSPSNLSDASSTSYQPPPSPTLSAHSAGSVRWATSTELRSNRPEENDGLSSLGLLHPHSGRKGHSRRGSATSDLSGSETEADHSSIGLTPMSPRSDGGSTLHSPTGTHVDSGSDDESPSLFHRLKRHSRSPSREPADDSDVDTDANKGKPEHELARPDHFDLSQEADFDPAPFAFKPFQLANLVDPKNIEALEDMGGVSGLLRGLGTHETRGLGGGPSPDSTAGGGGPSPRPDKDDDNMPKPDIKLIGPGGEDEGLASLHAPSLFSVAGPSTAPHGNGDPYSASIDKRREVFGANILPTRASKSLWLLMWLALKDKVLVLLSIAAVISLALGFFQDFGPARTPGEPPVDWVEGVAIIVAIMIVVMVGSLNDWQKERQFKVLNAKKEERSIKVIRGGDERLINVNDVVVGDIALLEPGEIVPCDGVFLSGHNVRCDESGATGESDAIKKASYTECIALREAKLAEWNPAKATDDDGDVKQKPSGMDLLGHTDCFIVSGSKVIEGVGSYVIISVGTKSFNGRIMMALRGDAENTPLQLKLNDLAETIAKVGSIAGLILFTALMIRFFVQIGQGVPERTANQKGIAFVNILIIAVTLIVVAVPEGLPLAVTLALAFATKCMTKENLLVRVLGSCKTMANSSVVCTDKTGTLTQNEMTVVAGSVGVHGKFVRENNQDRHNADSMNKNREQASDSGERKHKMDFALDLADLDTVISPALRTLFNEAIAVNSTAFEDTDEKGQEVFIGSKTETALLKMARELKWPNYKTTRDSVQVLQMIPFSSERKAMGVVVGLPNGRARMYVKGASEILTEKCTTHVRVDKEGAQDVNGKEVETHEIDELDADNISRTIRFYASQMLRTIALCYRDFESWPPPGAQCNDENEVAYEDLARELTLIAITGIEDPLRPGVREAVADCSKAGVRVKMCTGDNVLTARSIAQQCGIYTPGGIVMEGPVFRKLPTEVRRQVVPRLQVLARSSPEDKRVLVDTLKDLGEVVGVTGDGTNDGPALKTANVGFSMGIAGTEVAKEASDIILMDDNFASIVKAIMWGRCVNDAVRKFLQFQISTNVTAVVITLVSAIASSEEESVLSAVQLLWINIIMDTFAALALATDPASPALLDRQPDKKWAPLFSVDMIKQIIGQSIYQIIVILIFHFLGAKILGFGSEGDRHVQTLVFNAFVFAQIFNSVNCRRLDNKLNIFEGISRNWYFIVITLIEIGGQVLIVFVGGAAFQVTPIAGREWGISLALGVVSIPLGALIRYVPNAPCERFFKLVHLIPNPEVLPTARPDAEPGLGFAMDRVRDNLGTFSTVRGGRMRSSSFVVKSRSGRPEEGVSGVVPGLLTMLPSLVGAQIVGSHWVPRNGGSLSDPAGFDPSKSSTALWENKFEVHPDTPKDDPVFKILGAAAAAR
ncbi:hypothetical protein OF83DRAFT_1143615, partial [Amylostereum chailletii]